MLIYTLFLARLGAAYPMVLSVCMYVRLSALCTIFHYYFHLLNETFFCFIWAIFGFLKHFNISNVFHWLFHLFQWLFHVFYLLFHMFQWLFLVFHMIFWLFHWVFCLFH